jgi:hypothetical protein
MQAQQSDGVQLAAMDSPAAEMIEAPVGAQEPEAKMPGSISGTVVDRSGAVVAGARVKLTLEGASVNPESVTGEDGQFSFTKIIPGTFQLTVTLEGFAAQTASGTLHSGESYVVPPIALVVATAVTDVQVTMSRYEEAEAQLKEEEKQRVLGFIPNFYVTYVPDAIPLTTKQKYRLALKATVDPATFLITAGVAGVQQAQNDFSGYGQGAEGYAKRYGASYADVVTSTFLSGAVFPSLLKQDPRYFYKGTGTKSSRFWYAIANSVICKGDNGKWQANYSEIMGSLAAGGISNLYYPDKDRGAALTFENTLIGLGANAAVNLLQEFVIRKFTPNVPNYAPNKASGAVSKVWNTFAHEGN